MKRLLAPLLACLLALLPLEGRSQVETTALPASAAPRVIALKGDLELDRIIELRVDQLQAWSVRAGGPADPGNTMAAGHPAWGLVPYIDGRALKGLTPLAVDLGQGLLQFHLRITPENQDTWTHLLGPLTFQRPVRLSVGLVEVDPFATDFTLENSRALLTVINWRWMLAAALVVLVFGIAFCALATHTTLLMERTSTTQDQRAHRFSLAKVQLALWFFVVISAFLAIWLSTGNYDSVNGSILSTLSISAGTALGDTLLKAAGPGVAALPAQAVRADEFFAPPWTAKRFMRDLVSDDEGCSLSRFQMLAWTMALVLVFLADVYEDLQMPVFGPELLYLLGLSSGTYMAHRVPEMLRERQRPLPVPALADKPAAPTSSAALASLTGTVNTS